MPENRKEEKEDIKKENIARRTERKRRYLEDGQKGREESEKKDRKE